MIYQIRGSMGSGKTTLMRALMAKFGALSQMPSKIKPKSKRPEAYCGVWGGATVAVLGPYGESATGGMDNINSVADSIDLIDRYSTFDIVLYEGMMLGHIYGRHGAAMLERYGSRHIFAFLDTPLDLCIERVRQRRAERGNMKPFDPKNVVQSHETVESSRLRIESHGGETVWIPHGNALNTALRHLRRYSK